MTRVNAYANFITKQRRIENNGLLRSGSSSDEGELLNEIFFDYGRESKAAFNTSVGAKLGAVTGAALGGISAFKSAYQTTGDPVVSSFVGVFGGAASGLAGAGFGSLVGNVIGSYEDKKEYQKNLQYQRNMEQQNLALQNIKAKNEHLRAVALAERKRQVEGRLHSLRNQHGVNMTRIPTGNGPNDTAVRITGGPLPQGHEIVFHDNHSVSNDNEPSEFTWEHNVAMQRMTSPTGEGVTVKKPVDSSSHSDLDSSITNLNSHLQKLGRRRTGALTESAWRYAGGLTGGLLGTFPGSSVGQTVGYLASGGDPLITNLATLAGTGIGAYILGKLGHGLGLEKDHSNALAHYYDTYHKYGKDHPETIKANKKLSYLQDKVYKFDKFARSIPLPGGYP